MIQEWNLKMMTPWMSRILPNLCLQISFALSVRALPFYPDIIYIYSLYMHTYILIYDHINKIKYTHIYIYIPIGSMYGIFTYMNG